MILLSEIKALFTHINQQNTKRSKRTANYNYKYDIRLSLSSLPLPPLYQIHSIATMNSDRNRPGNMSPNPNTPSRGRNNNNNNNRTKNGNNNQSSSRQGQNQGQGQGQGSNKPPVPMSGIPFGYIPAFLPGSASLVEQLDRRIMIVLRDGRHLVGILRSFDQFSNMVLDQTSERRVLHTKKSNKGAEDEVICYYTDILLGLYLVRGDSMVLLGEVDNDEGEDDKKEAVVTAGHNSSFSAEGLTGSGLLMGSSVEKEQAKKHMKKVSLKEFEEMEKKLKEKKEADPINELTWEFDLDLVV